MNFVVESERLLLRQFEIADVEEYYQMTRDPLIQYYVSFACENTIEETLNAIKQIVKTKNTKDIFDEFNSVCTNLIKLGFENKIAMLVLLGNILYGLSLTVPAVNRCLVTITLSKVS